MFDVLVYLFENYHNPDSCPDAGSLAKKLSAVGFEDDSITDAIDWLRGLATSTEDVLPISLVDSTGTRIYTHQEHDRLGPEAIGFIQFLENSETIDAPLREIIVERAMAFGESPVPLNHLKVCALMVLWSQEAQVDHLIFEELIDEGDEPALMN